MALGLRWENLTKIKDEFGHSFSSDRFSKKTNDYKAEYNLGDIDISKAIENINFESLSSRVVKRNDSISIYADLDGFTALMDGVETEADAKNMVRLFTGIRNEIEDVLTVDFENGAKVQQRGDCILANYHVPAAMDFESKRTLAAVEAAVSLMSSMELLNKYYQPTRALALQVGEASGKVFFSRIGKNGAKSPAVVGRSVDKAESLQQQSAPGEIRICPRTFDRLPDGALKESFNESADGESYATKNMTSKRLIDLEDRKLANAAFEERARAEVVRPGFFHVGVAESKEDWRHVNTPPHFSGRKNCVLGDN